MIHTLFTNWYSTHNPLGFAILAVASIVLVVAIMWALHQLPPVGKKWLIISTTFVAGLFFVIEYFWPTHLDGTDRVNLLTPYVTPVSLYMNAILIWVVLMGLISLVLVHGKRLLKGVPGWHNSLAFFLALITMMVAGFVSSLGVSTAGIGKAASTVYNSLFYGLLVNLDAAMFSLLAFYIASSAYRAFRVRTLEAAMLMVSALIVMLGMVNIGLYLTKWIPDQSGLAFFRIENFAQWIQNWVNAPTQSAVIIGVAVGALAMAMRIWLSLERGAFFSQEK